MNNPQKLLENIIYEIPCHTDERGTLSFLQNGSLKISDVSFEFQRAFWIYNVPANAERGNHAHRTCTELLIAIHGSFDLELSDGVDTRVIHLDSPSKAVLIRPMVWCRLCHFSSDFVGLCLATQPYIADGYINSYDEFLNK